MRSLTSSERRLLYAFYLIGLLGALQYTGVTFWLMSFYPGGRIGFRGSAGYDFMMNFLSDLARTSGFGRGHNPTSFGYMMTLASAGVSTIIFFSALSYYFFRQTGSTGAILCALLGLVAGGGYIGVALNPIDEGYWIHVKYVQWGFIGFWTMILVVAYFIFRTPSFSNFYGRMLLIFAAILGIQICIMLLGPRSWSSEGALFLQVTAQKIVVYSEILVMSLLAFGAMRALGKGQRA
jgi:hypothetical protein